MSDYSQCKLTVKRWEKEFFSLHGRVPSKHDIKEASREVRRAYGRYYRLKSQMLENAVEGLLLADRSPSPPPPSPAPAMSPPINLPSVAQIEQLIASEKKSPSQKVWGEHLNKSHQETSTERVTKSVINVSTKLFASCSFNKRNPRKLLNRSKSKLSQSESTQSQEILDSKQRQLEPVTQQTTQVPKNLMTSACVSLKSSVRTINKDWVERCAGPTEELPKLETDNSTSSKPTEAHDKYGLKNIKIPQSYIHNITSDFIENSESEDENPGVKKYQRIRPVVKKRKAETSEHAENNESQVTNETSTIVPEKKTERKRPNKCIAELDDNENFESQNELERLSDVIIEMPRFPISAEVLKNEDLIDGLTTALTLPKPKKGKTKSNATAKEEQIAKKIKNGTLNENFVRINIEKKVYVRGKKSVNYSKYKKQQWKKKTKALNELGPEFPENGVLKCFKCNQTGHLSRYCRAHKGETLLPLENYSEDSSHKTMEEVSLSQTKKHEVDKSFIFKPITEELNVDKYKPSMELVPESFVKLLSAPIQNIFSYKTIEPLYTLTHEGTLRDTPAEVYDALRLFGHESFKNGQERAIMRILSGLSTLVTLTTGSGKSLCYQIPAYIFSRHEKCITLVISPLVSLMEDQVVNMPSFVRAACLHTNQTPTVRQKIIDLIKSGDINILLISPEAVVSGEHSTGFGSLLKQLPPIAFACIDEVHCVSQWSHNFRPSYLIICRVLREKMGIKCILGLTATATVSTTRSIVDHIGVHDGIEGVITNLPIPNNLILTVSKDKMRDGALLELLRSERFADSQSLIIYCIRRDECERIARLIRTSMQNTVNKKRKRFDNNVETYHAGMSAAARRRVQQAFTSGDLKIVVATVAFGMGINKSDIRGVIHYNMPGSFESYVQEVGRAGRDGLVAHCHAFVDSKDKFELLKHIHANSIERFVIRKLLQKVFVPCACKTIKESRCQGHEVAFSIDETVDELDLPSENICTLLCYLELHSKESVKILSNVYITCKISTYGTDAELLNAAKKCPPLAMAVALEKKKGNFGNDSKLFEFCVIEVAAAIGWPSGLVKYHLKQLEWDKNDGKVKRSIFKVEFHTLGFHMQASGDLSPSELDETLDAIYERTQLQEKTMLHQLKIISSTLNDVAYPDVTEHDNEGFREASKKLRSSIQEYFLQSEPQISEVTNDDPSMNEEQVISDVRALISAYKDCSFTGKAIARIFQGISSPNFPAIVWGRCRFWRIHLYEDFYKLVKIAKKQIMSMR